MLFHTASDGASQRSGLTRRGCLALAMGAAFARAHADSEAPFAALPLADAAAAAHAKGRALLVLFSVPGCPWCKLVRESYLAPLIAQGQPTLELDMTGSRAVGAFGGSIVTEKQLARALRIDFAPTVLFVGPQGEELADRLRGVSSADFYGAYLQDRVATANAAAARK